MSSPDGNDGIDFFDKFIDDILIKERSTSTRQTPEVDDTPQRRYNKMYRETPQNRTKFRR